MRWSYSAYGCYKQCPAKYKFRYKEKHQVERMTHPAAQRGTNTHALFEKSLKGELAVLDPPWDYYNGFLSTLREHKAQPELIIVLDRNWQPAPPWEEGWVKAILDASLVNGTRGHHYDWKTGGIYPEHGDQREIYSIVQLCQFPDIEESEGTHVYLDKKQNRSSLVKRSELDELKHKWEEKVKPLYEDELFQTNPGFYCRSCEFSKRSGGPCRF